MPSLREPGYSRIPQEATQRDANNREMLGFHQQIYDHAMGRIAANDQVPRYTTLVDKLLGMNPYLDRGGNAPAAAVPNAQSAMAGPSYQGPGAPSNGGANLPTAMASRAYQGSGAPSNGGANLPTAMASRAYQGSGAPSNGGANLPTAMASRAYQGSGPPSNGGASQSRAQIQGNTGAGSAMAGPSYQGPVAVQQTQSPGNGQPQATDQYGSGFSGGPVTNTAPTQVTPQLASTGPGPQMNAAPVFQPINPYQPTGGSVVSQPSFMEDPMYGGGLQTGGGINPNKSPLDFNPFGAAQPGLFGTRGSVGRPGGY